MKEEQGVLRSRKSFTDATTDLIGEKSDGRDEFRLQIYAKYSGNVALCSLKHFPLGSYYKSTFSSHHLSTIQ